MSRPAGPSEQLTWDATFLFQGRDGATIFSEDTALTIEYYPYKASKPAIPTKDALHSPLGLSWGCRAPNQLLSPVFPVWDAPGTLVPVGYSVLPLTSRIFRELTVQSGGMCLDGLTIQVSGLVWGWYL